MAFSFKATITINNAQVSDADTANFTDFPVLISGTYDGTGTEPDLRVAGSGGNVQNANGYDIKFYSDADLTTELAYERVNWVDTTGECQFYVKVPTLNYDSDTLIYIGYGDASIETDSQDKANTWNSSYLGVWHLQEASGAIADSVGTAAHSSGTTVGDPDYQQAGPTAFKYSIGFNAGTEHFSCANSGDFNVGTGAWVGDILLKMDGSIALNQGWMGDGWNNYPLGLEMYVFQGYRPEILTVNSAYKVGTADTLATGTWHHVVARRNTSGVLDWILNGNVITVGTQAGTVATIDDWQIGGWDRGGSNDWWGNLAAAKFMTGNVTDGYLITEYNNLNDPSAFYTMGDETAIAAAVVSTSPNYIKHLNNSSKIRRIQ